MSTTYSVAFAASILLMFISGCALQNGMNLRAHDEKIEKWLMAQTPYGTEFSEVLAHTKDRGWYQSMRGAMIEVTRSQFIRGRRFHVTG